MLATPDSKAVTAVTKLVEFTGSLLRELQEYPAASLLTLYSVHEPLREIVKAIALLDKQAVLSAIAAKTKSASLALLTSTITMLSTLDGDKLVSEAESVAATILDTDCELHGLFKDEIHLVRFLCAVCGVDYDKKLKKGTESPSAQDNPFGLPSFARTDLNTAYKLLSKAVMALGDLGMRFGSTHALERAQKEIVLSSKWLAPYDAFTLSQMDDALLDDNLFEGRARTTLLHLCAILSKELSDREAIGSLLLRGGDEFNTAEALGGFKNYQTILLHCALYMRNIRTAISRKGINLAFQASKPASDLLCLIDAALLTYDPETIEAPNEKESDGLLVIGAVDHLKTDDRKVFQKIAGKTLPYSEMPDIFAVSRTLKAKFPWAPDIIDALLLDLVGRPFAQVRPTVLVGRPGSGKSALACELNEAVFGLPPAIYNAAGSHDASFAGTSRQWHSGRPSLPLQTIIRHQIANPMLIIDEIDKVSTGKDNGALQDAILAMLERRTNDKMLDPFAEIPCNLSCVSYIFTANSMEAIPQALRSRMRVLSMPMPAEKHLPVLVDMMMEETRKERNLNAYFMPNLAPDELDLIAGAWKHAKSYERNLRLIRRAVDVVIAGRERISVFH